MYFREEGEGTETEELECRKGGTGIGKWIGKERVLCYSIEIV
jgi:hypothetical protein